VPHPRPIRKELNSKLEEMAKMRRLTLRSLSTMEEKQPGLYTNLSKTNYVNKFGKIEGKIEWAT
jgi:hypothetical protein